MENMPTSGSAQGTLQVFTDRDLRASVSNMPDGHAALHSSTLSATLPAPREGWLSDAAEPLAIAAPRKRDAFRPRAMKLREAPSRARVRPAGKIAPAVRDRSEGHRSSEEHWCRAFDITIAILAIILFLPLICLVAASLWVSGLQSSRRGSVLFVQNRVGRHGKPFPCLKFRTMVINAPQVLDDLLNSCPQARREWDRDQKLRNDPRITRIGSFLRKSSLDELPQLFNILAGHMSVVGPRPIVANEVPRYGSRFAAYCSIRPGLTGLWQVSGRNEVSYEARVRLDAYYAQRKSTAYDFLICLRTVPAVLASRGCY